jgi:ATP-dependent RNA helicase RhlB
VIAKKEYSDTMKFSELPLTEKTRKGIEGAGFETCMPVQEKVFEQSLSGGDVMVQSQTGTGKTAAFLITILEKFTRKEEKQSIKALVIVPTRELAVQIEHDAKILAAGIKELRIGTFYGGVGYKSQDDQLSKGVDLYIGTPGRLMDYGKTRKLDFNEMDIVVVDEADRLFDMGFYQDILHMFKKMRKKEERQTLLFSATLTGRARNLAWDFMNNPVEIDIETDSITVDEINQQLFHVSKNEKFSLLLNILAKESPENAIIFTNTKSMAVEVAKRLEINGYDAHILMGDLPQSKRLQVIQKMKKGEIRFLVATDVAARGLHVEDLELVVNYDIPEDYENYVHRVGRTARAGKSGLAITLACEQFVYGLEPIEEYIQMKIPVVWPDKEVYPPVSDKSANMSFRDLVRSYRTDKGGGRTSRSKGKPAPRRTGSKTRSPRQSAPKGASAPKEASEPKGRDDKPRSKSKPRNNDKPHSSERARSNDRPRSNNRPQGGDKGKRAPQSKRGSAPRSQKNTAPPKSSAAIEHLSFEERLAYYKKKYAGELEKQERPAAKGRKSGSRSGGSSSRKPQPKQPEQQKDEKSTSQAESPKIETPVKPKGILKRILKGNKQ